MSEQCTGLHRVARRLAQELRPWTIGRLESRNCPVPDHVLQFKLRPRPLYTPVSIGGHDEHPQRTWVPISSARLMSWILGANSFLLQTFPPRSCPTRHHVKCGCHFGQPSKTVDTSSTARQLKHVASQHIYLPRAIFFPASSPPVLSYSPCRRSGLVQPS